MTGLRTSDINRQETSTDFEKLKINGIELMENI